ncbi:hypothetical protein M2650_16195 [Luteimonas sp. SX5]|uniref:Uncharacterized protein n=1 Tax=Luteimonas galliterrae TaxID=2940486 RepID=A0ABT0MMP4_9GAMM|nr:hypothetical protein [Luteimonas galliterrae]MCL1636162.1 hypothetical protein [Luteimonas galliterrae]
MRAAERNPQRAFADAMRVVQMAIPPDALLRTDSENCRMALTSSVSKVTIACGLLRFRLHAALHRTDAMRSVHLCICFI